MTQGDWSAVSTIVNARHGKATSFLLIFLFLRWASSCLRQAKWEGCWPNDMLEFKFLLSTAVKKDCWDPELLLPWWHVLMLHFSSLYCTYKTNLVVPTEGDWCLLCPLFCYWQSLQSVYKAATWIDKTQVTQNPLSHQLICLWPTG